MKFGKFFLTGMALSIALVFTACEGNEENGGGNGGGNGSETMMEVSGTWEAGTIRQITKHVVIPEGSSLTIEPGVQVIFSTDGVGVNHVPIEFIVEGNLYCEGTAENPVRFTIAEELRTEENALKGMWGGIVAMESCSEMLIDHTIIEYTGGQVIEGSPAATAQVYVAGDDAYPQITTNNVAGRYVITNSVLRYGWSDAIYLMGGSAIIAGNIFAGNGNDGGESVNVKAGCTADIAGNVMFSPNTNGLKLSSSGQSENRSQARVCAYNNTIINAGWRRDGEKGGCIYAEKNVLANVFNNLMVNCKFRAMTPSYTIPNDPEEGYDTSSFIDYNFYASGSRPSDIVFPEESNVAYAWEGYNYAHEDYNPEVDTHSVIATETESRDPLFVNFDLDAVALTDYIYDDAWDFHVAAGSPVLSGASTRTDIAPYFAGTGLVLDGKTHTSPAVAARFGAYGVNR